MDAFDEAVAFYRVALGLRQHADWSSADGRVVVLEAGRATLELFDAAQAEYVDRIEAGARVSGTVRLAFEVPDSEAAARRLAAAGGTPEATPRPRRGATATHACGRRTACSSPSSRLAEPVRRRAATSAAHR